MGKQNNNNQQLRTTRMSVLESMKMRIFNVLGLVILMLGLTACPSPDDPYVDIISVTSCSPDLLEFVTPTVTVTADNGQSESFTLSPTDFEESTEGGSINITVNVNGNESSSGSTVVDYVAKRMMHFEDVTSMSGRIEVRYALRPDVKPDKESYVFFHGVGYNSKVSDGDSFTISGNGGYIKPTAHQVSKDEVQKYLNDLVSSTDQTRFAVSFGEKK